MRFCGTALIPVRHLLNGATVRQKDVASVDYWHVELPAESFLDTGNRATFADAAVLAASDHVAAGVTPSGSGTRPRQPRHRVRISPAFPVPNQLLRP
jgi:hypothetical protein